MDIRLLWLIGLLLWTPVMAWGESVTIQVQPRAVVQGTQVTLGEVAMIEGGPPQSVAKVRDIVIGQAPPLGEERTLPGEYVRTRLKQHGFQPDAMLLEVPARIVVTRASQRLSTRDLEAAVLRAITAQMPWHPRQTTVRDLRGIEPVHLPPGPIEYDVTFAANSDFLGPTAFTMLFRVDGHTAARLSGTAYIEVTQEVVTPARSIARNEVISVQDLRITQVPMSPRSAQILTRAEDVVGKRAKRSLQPNATIRATEIEDRPLVQKGDAVLIVIDTGVLKVTAMGQALEQGLRGETIRIKNPTSDREVRAVVLDAKTVRVPF
jgi:flagella basal body P-ring formation protein FlgA